MGGLGGTGEGREEEVAGQGQGTTSRDGNNRHPDGPYPGSEGDAGGRGNKDGSGNRVKDGSDNSDSYWEMYEDLYGSHNLRLIRRIEFKKKKNP